MAQALDFDFQGFAVAAIKTIDELRSYGDQEAKSPIESRINAFYRALGLPSYNKKESNKTIDPTNTGNICGTMNASEEKKFRERESEFSVKASKPEWQQMLHFDKKSKPSDSLEKRTRGKLFPMKVNGDIVVYPQNKRVATPFMHDDDIEVGDGKDKYMRPFIEAVIYMRLKTAGATNQEQQGKALADFNAAFNKGKTGSEVKENITWANLRVIKTIREAIVTAVGEFSKAITRTGSLAGDVNLDVFQLSAGDIAEQNPVQVESTEVTPPVYTALQQKAAIKQAFLTQLEFSDSNADSSKKNAIESSLLSSLLSILNADEKMNEDKKVVKQKGQKSTAELKQYIKTLNLFTGNFAGISGLDVLVVTTALFEIEIKYLLGLLSEDAYTNLKVIKKGIESQQRENVTSSLDALEARVRAIYEGIDVEVLNTKHSNKTETKSGGGK
jgi:hypothetical protein